MEANDCEHCSYFYETNRRANSQAGDISQLIGYCRANPPIPFYENDQPKVARFPVVLGHMWCGLFEGMVQYDEEGRPVK
jgi:hypothetical protein